MSFKHQFLRLTSVKSSKKFSKEPVFLNILMTDVRPASVQQKLMNFYALIDRCLLDCRRVNLVVVVSRGGEASALCVYSAHLDKYLNNEYFDLILIRPVSRSLNRILAIFYTFNCFTKLRGRLVQRINFACLTAFSRVRIKIFQCIYDALPCEHWLGLSGGVELPTFKSRRDHSGTKSMISALQFGQASLEQQHFSGYNADNFFVYDDLSKLIYQKLNMQVHNMVVTGSPEFEYHTSLLCNEKLLKEDRLNVLFVDQPVQQRGEYTKDYLEACYAMLDELNNDPNITLKLKLHPRGSAFSSPQLSGFSVVDDWSASLSSSHVVIGFFSNLCDLGLRNGRVTFYLGSESILDQAKQDWVVSQGGYVIDDIDSVKQMIEQLKKQYTQLSMQIMQRAAMETELPSELIYKRMVANSESKAFA